ncbi:hypothetical protein SAMN05444396_11189 [Flavobacterium segetis]|uniref:Uncharacterized protein n=1 Tax=Flavobacterium segetis TaxID=271157 RepID=A0A1M5JMD8_9FLAO|nr:hypothetical protein [Flavobacterium segetis]SHG41429.1 hypothetical protein SAMN05444396_11189 [Flavobacterium segetis]
MIYSYFQIKDKHYKVLNGIKNNLYSQNNKSSVKKKVKKLNEYQFYFIFNDLMQYYKIEHFPIDVLELFFERSKITINKSEYFSFKESGNLKGFVPVNVDWVDFNCKNDLDSFIDYFLHTKEYPKETLLTKLLVLSDKLFENIFHPLMNIQMRLEDYIENSNRNGNAIKYDYLEQIILALDNQQKHILELSYSIQEKVDKLAKNTKGQNYLIVTDDEILKKLYRELNKFDFIDENKTTLEQFIEVLKSDWKAHNSVIYLNLDNIQFKFFIDCISQFLSTKIPLSFIQLAGNIENNNGKINAKSVCSSTSKSIMPPKKNDIIRSIFEKL